MNRRQFGKISSLAATATFGFQFIPSRAWGNLTKPALAGIGAGGKGRTDISEAKKAGFEIVALVDVIDAKKLAKASGRLKSMADTRADHDQAAFFTDYREMYEKMGDKIDAVTVSTPDHHHFHASVMAMKRGKHVYCQKPLTHGIWEARMMAQLAEKYGVKTQMGNQAHANDHMRRCVELIRAGIIGKVTEIHAWTNRPIWPQGFAKAPEKQPVPEWLDWESWVGPAPWVDYHENIAPFNWRGWWDYGTGALGDMACHIMDMGYWALMPGAPKSVRAQQEGATPLSPPINSKIVWDFAPSDHTSKNGFRYFWYDGYIDAHFDRESWKLVKNGNEYNHPGEDVMQGEKFTDYGSVIIGEEGRMYFNRSRNNWVVKTSSKVDGFDWPEKTLHRATSQNNYVDWMDAILGKIPQADSHFGHAGPFTETILLGVLAQMVPDTVLKWNHPQMKVQGRPDLDAKIHRPYRKGWEIEI